MVLPRKTIGALLLAAAVWVQSDAAVHAAASVQGWLNWRGPDQNGRSLETNLVDSFTVNGTNHLWAYALPGRGTPVIAGNRVYAFGYDGEGVELREVLVCLDADTGSKLWVHHFNDFISDVIYNRYSIGSPTIDPETGNVYILTSPGVFAGFTAYGRMLWQHSMMEAFGRLTFPNGRTGAPVIDDNLVIVRGITTNWGRQGPARDRFYAFHKMSGRHVWASTPGVRPTDSSFSMPVLSWLHGKRVFYCGTGCGNIVCVNARTGEPLARFQFLTGGVNSSVLIYKDHRIITIHGKENLDTSEIGRMAAIQMGVQADGGNLGPVVLEPAAEIWRNPLGIFTSSPVLVDNRVYQVTHTGNLCCVDADSGKILWQKKLSYTQLHASPIFADGKLYVPMKDGSFYVLRPSDAGAEELCKVQLEGTCLGAPAVWDGKIYVHTTKKLYCFGKRGRNPGLPPAPAVAQPPQPGPAVRLQAIPSEFLLRPGDTQSFTIRTIDANGHVVPDVANPEWEKFIPPTAKVRVKMNADFDDAGRLVVAADNKPSAGAFKVAAAGLNGFVRGRVLPRLPIRENFESFNVSVPHKLESNVTFAYPPLPWIGARFKWEIRERDGNKILTKTLDRILFQRTTTFIGHPDMKDYIVQADVMSDGNRRIMSTVGVVNQRYIIALKGNWQQLEVSSNHDRLKVGVPFAWRPGVWYRLKTRVDTAGDGTGFIRARAWERDGAEPDDWTIEVPHRYAHMRGSPGLFGFSPQSKKRVYIDNIVITPN